MGQSDYVVLRAIGTSDDTDLAAGTFKYASKPSSALCLGEGVQRGMASVYFYGTDANNETFAWTLYAYKHDDSPAEFVANGTGILGTAQTGTTNEFYADTIAITTQGWNSNIAIVDSGNNRVCKMIFDSLGYKYFYCVMAKTTCASMGAKIGFANSDGLSGNTALASLLPYSSVYSDVLTLAGTAELLIKAYDAGTAYTVGQVRSSSGVVYKCIQNGTNKTPATETAYWTAITPRSVLFSTPSTNGHNVTWGSSVHRGQTLEPGSMGVEMRVTTEGILTLYVLGTALEYVNIVVYV